MANGLLDFLQGASNAAAANVSAPVDGLTWLLNKLGADIKTPVGGSDWMRERGLTAEPTNKLAGILGESVGGVLPMVTAAKAPQIAQGLLQAERNLAAPRTLNPQAGMIRTPFGQIPENGTDVSKLGGRLEKLLDDTGLPYSYDRSNISPSRYYTIDNPKNPDASYTVRISNHRDIHGGGDISVDPQNGATFEQMLDSLRGIGVPVADRVKADRSIGKKVAERLNVALGLGDGSLIKKAGQLSGGIRSDAFAKSNYKDLEQRLYGIANKPRDQYTKVDLLEIEKIFDELR